MLFTPPHVSKTDSLNTYVEYVHLNVVVHISLFKMLVLAIGDLFIPDRASVCYAFLFKTILCTFLTRACQIKYDTLL